MSHALAEWDSDKTLYVFTSLTAGSSHIVTATSRIETILRANRLHFTYIDTATNESARKLYGRRGRGKKLPLLVKQGEILGDLNEIEEFNEFGELKQVVGELPPPTEKSVVAPPAKMAGPYSGPNSAASTPNKGVGAAAASPAAPVAKPAPAPAAPAQPRNASGTSAGTTAALLMASSSSAAKAAAQPGKENAQSQLPMRGLAAEVAAKAQEKKRKEVEAIKASLQADQDAAGKAPVSEKAVEDTPKQLSPSASQEAAQQAEAPGAEAPGTAAPDLAPPATRSHRGSSLSMASEEEIKEIEKARAIPEEREEEAEAAGNEAKADHAKEEEESEKPKADVKDNQDIAADAGKETTTAAPVKDVDESEPPVDEAHETATAGEASEDTAAADPPAVDALKQDASNTAGQAEPSDGADSLRDKADDAPAADTATEPKQVDTPVATQDADKASEAADGEAVAVEKAGTSSAAKDEGKSEGDKAVEDDAGQSKQEQAAASGEDATKSVQD